MAYIAYGRIEATIGTRFPHERIGETLQKILRKLRSPAVSQLSFKSMLDWPSKTIYVLGKKRKLTNDPTLMDDKNYFFYEKGSDFTKSFDSSFRKYLLDRIKEEATRSNIRIDFFKVKVGRYRSKQASFRSIDKLFEFDRRVFAYAPIVVDSVIDHELSHTVSIRHDKEFYRILYRQIPERIYKNSKWIITTGNFGSDPYAL